MAEVAYLFHFPPSELWGMDINELIMWHKEGRGIHGKLVG